MTTLTAHDYHELVTDVLMEVQRATSPEEAMTCAVEVLKARLSHYSWVGIYEMTPAGDELVLGPFLGTPSPHVRIPLNRGICGAAASEKQTIVVDDVNGDPRYLACSLETKSEIVVPILDGDKVYGEIDVDSDQPAAFTALDRQLLERVAVALAQRMRG